MSEGVDSVLILDRFLPYQLSITSNAVSELIAGEYRNRFGLKIPEWRLLAVLGQGDGVKQRDLVHATRMDKVTVNRAAKALADRALIERRAASGDARSHLLLLTATGRALYDDIAPAALAMERAVLDSLTETEQETLSALLAKTLAAVEGLRRG